MYNNISISNRENKKSRELNSVLAIIIIVCVFVTGISFAATSEVSAASKEVTFIGTIKVTDQDFWDTYQNNIDKKLNTWNKGKYTKYPLIIIGVNTKNATGPRIKNDKNWGGFLFSNFPGPQRKGTQAKIKKINKKKHTITIQSKRIVYVKKGKKLKISSTIFTGKKYTGRGNGYIIYADSSIKYNGKNKQKYTVKFSKKNARTLPYSI